MEQKKASSRMLHFNLAQVIQEHERHGGGMGATTNNSRRQRKNKQTNHHLQQQPQKANGNQIVVLASLHDMFPDVDKSVVELLLQEHDFDVDATVAQLFSMAQPEETKAQREQTAVGNGSTHQKSTTKATVKKGGSKASVAMSDEELARKLTADMEREEREKRTAQEKADEAMARTMMSDGGSPNHGRDQHDELAVSETKHKSSNGNAGKKSGGDVRGEGGKWNVKQPPQQTRSSTDTGAEHISREDGGSETTDSQWEAALSKKARRRRNKRLNLEKTACASNEKIKPPKQAISRPQSMEEKLVSSQDKPSVLAFMQNIFSSLDQSLIEIVYEENECDLERTTEALLMLTCVDEPESALASSPETADDDSSPRGDISSASTSSSGSPALSDDETSGSDAIEDWERIDEIISRMVQEGERESGVSPDADDEEEVNSLDDLKLQYGDQSPSSPADEHHAKGSFTSGLDTLAEMFPEYDRQALAVALEANDDDIELTTEELLAQAFNASLRRSGGRIAHARVPTPKRKLTWGIRQDEVLAKMGVAGKVQTPPPLYTYQPTTGPHGATKMSAPETQPSVTKLDMSAKLKLQSLAQHFWNVDSELLQSVFLQCGCNVGRTIRALGEIDPTLTWKRQPSKPTPSAVDNAEMVINTKRPDTQKPEEAQTPKRKTSTERRERHRQEKFTVVSRKKRQARGGYSKHDNDIDLREAALDHASLRNKYYMEATQAYMRGDGQAAKQLSQKGREHDELMKEYYTRAADQIFAPNDNSLHTVDLHKLTVPVALNVLERLLQLHEQKRKRNPNASSWVSVITGVGRHSQGGRAQIKPAVVRFLKENKYRYREVDGVVFIRVR